jgi:hypothetical protein
MAHHQLGLSRTTACMQPGDQVLYIIKELFIVYVTVHIFEL